MEGHSHDRYRRVAASALATSALAVTLTGASTTLAQEATSLPECTDVASIEGRGGEIVTPWRAVLDEDGVLMEHRMTLRREGVETTLRTGPHAFAMPGRSGRILVGERSEAGTTLTMLDTDHVCRVWGRHLDRHAYPLEAPVRSGLLRMAAHEPGTRRFAGTLVIRADSGATEAMIDGQCSTTCNPNDGEVLPAALGPIVAARPVPAFAAGGWRGGKTLAFRWQPGAVPPRWAREPLKAVAEDASRTSAARSPRFVHRGDAHDSVRYTTAFPSFCRYGIACASRNLPSAWAVWLRPHGTDFSWGLLRWCQKRDVPGCFDIQRVMLHELGHVTGLQHPSSFGFRLAAKETVMHAITPAKPRAGSTRHRFGRCDVATLQELYGRPSTETLISSCNGLNTVLRLRATKSSIARGETVTLRADLNITDHGSYGLLAGDALDGREVRLKYRRAGSSDAWASILMQPRTASGRYAVSLAPEATWEFKAIFPAPSREGLRSSRSRIVKVKVVGDPAPDQPET